MGIAKEANKARRTKQHQRVRYNEQIDAYLKANNLFKTYGGDVYPSTHKEKKEVKRQHEEYMAEHVNSHHAG